MSRKIGQKTYRARTLNKNEEVFTNQEVVYSLALYGIPGITFKINGTAGSITLNNTGIFQYASEEYPITSLKFADRFTLEANHYLTIDYIYTTSTEERNNHGQ